jgi:hypothetical protein
LCLLTGYNQIGECIKGGCITVDKSSKKRDKERRGVKHNQRYEFAWGMGRGCTQ